MYKIYEIIDFKITGELKIIYIPKQRSAYGGYSPKQFSIKAKQFLSSSHIRYSHQCFKQSQIHSYR